MSKNTEKKKPRLHTTISKETEELIEMYVNFTDKNNEIIYGNKSRVIEKAVELLDKYHNPEKEDILTLWNRARDEVNMALIGKWTFLSLITGDYKNLINENIAVDIIEWYKQKQIDDLSIFEILKAIKEIWVAANYFINIDIKVGSKGTFQMSLFHDFNNREYSEYWGKYFTMLLLKRKKYDIEYFTRISSLILKIKDLSEQEETVLHKDVEIEFLKKKGVPFFDGKGNFVGYFFNGSEDSKTEQNEKRVKKYEKKNL
ncbi:MAG: hypothetical protein ACFFAH_15540 [Promethearchaeota archaeon]